MGRHTLGGKERSDVARRMAAQPGPQRGLPGEGERRRKGNATRALRTHQLMTAPHAAFVGSEKRKMRRTSRGMHARGKRAHNAKEKGGRGGRIHKARGASKELETGSRLHLYLRVTGCLCGCGRACGVTLQVETSKREGGAFLSPNHVAARSEDVEAAREETEENQ